MHGSSFVRANAVNQQILRAAAVSA